jgi:hypothetical protein
MPSLSRYIALALCLLAPLTVRAETYFVRPGGNDQADGKTVAGAFQTLVRAAQVLNHGDQVVVAPGTYTTPALFAERFSADDSAMALIGDEDGKRTGAQPGPVIIQAERATEAALVFSRFRHLRLSGLTFRGRGQGLVLDKCYDVSVERCSFDGLARGLAVLQSSDVRIESAVFTRCTIGMILQGTVRARVAHVSVAGSTTVGLLALSCGTGSVTNSLFADNNSNLIADGISAPAWSSDHNVLQGSTGPWGDVPVVAKIYEWPAASGQDRHSIFVVPAFVDPARYDLHIAAQVTWGGGLPGMNIARELNPKVAYDRDGKPFRVRDGSVCAGAYDYPDPQPASGWTKVGAMTGKGTRQSAGLYRDDGTLLRTLLADAAGVRDLWWDGRDDQGQPAGPGKYQLKTLSHDARVRDDGSFGDNGSLLGMYNCDNANRVVGLPDGGFLISTFYDEAGFAVRRHASSGQTVYATNPAEKDFRALAFDGTDVYAVIGAGPQGKLVRLVLPGERAPMLNGAAFYALYGADEKTAAVAGLAVAGKKAYVAVAGLNVVRVFDLADGSKKADIAVPSVADIAADAGGNIWVLAGKEVVLLQPSGQLGQRFATSLEAPKYLTAGKERLAVVDSTAGKIALLDTAGKVLRTLGQTRPIGQWLPVQPELFREPRGCAFLTDGRLVVTEAQRVRILWPESGKLSQDLMSTFMDTAVVHPSKREFVYTALGAFRVDPKTGAWSWALEEPRGMTETAKDGKLRNVTYGMPAASVVLGGRPFVCYTTSNGTFHLFDVSDPMKPRLALHQTGLPAYVYQTFAFGKGGDLVLGGNGGLTFKVARFLGLDGEGNPKFDVAKAASFGPAKDPLEKRSLSQVGAIAADTATADVFYLAVTAYNNKMVPGWGADGTGVGKSGADGPPKWFAPSSGGNYMSIDAVHDGSNTWVLACKSFGGQIDLFDADGLRLTTGAWSWPCAWQFGFVDLRYGLRAYLRPDGKVGAYVEDDSIGRLGRARIDGLETVQKATTAIDWTTAATASAIPDAHAVQGKGLEKLLTIPQVPELKVDGDWSAWVKAGVTPQILALPAPTFKRSMPDDLFQTFRMGTAAGAVAHDGKNLYFYFVVSDDAPHFEAEKGGAMYMFDCVELWVEEEQFGLGMLKDGVPSLFKFRHHNAKNQPWSANYALPRDAIWAGKIRDLAGHPLGRQLADNVGVSLQGKGGYAVMARIPFDEIKLVGGIAGRTGKDILNTTGKPGEVLRIGVNISHIVAPGREQDFKVGWPSSIMFADPTRSYPFAFGK